MVPFSSIINFPNPINTIGVVALAKMCVGIIEAWIGGLIVLPLSLIFMGNSLDLTLTLQGGVLLLVVILLASISSATLGLLVGTIIKPSQRSEERRVGKERRGEG